MNVFFKKALAAVGTAAFIAGSAIGGSGTAGLGKGRAVDGTVFQSMQSIGQHAF